MPRIATQPTAQVLRPQTRPARKVAVGTAVAIVNYNGGVNLRACLRAVSAQSVAPERVLVFDNASHDGSCDGIARRFPNVEFQRFPHNRGFAAACNAAMQASHGCRWVAVLNSDAIPTRRWFARLTAAATKLPGCAAVSSQMLSADDPSRLDGAGDVYHVSGAAWRAGHGQSVDHYSHASQTRPREVFSACAAAALYRRDAVLEVGGFDESFFCYFEDVDLSYRLRLHGYRVWHAPRAVVRHVGSASTGVRSDFAVYHGHRNLVWTFFRNTPATLFWRYLPQHLAWNVATILWFALRGRAKVIIRSKWDAVRGLPRILCERARLQRGVTAKPKRLHRLMATGWMRPYFGRGARSDQESR